MSLNWEGRVARLAAVANDRPDDEALNQDEDNGGNGEDEVIEAADLQRLIGHCWQWEGGLTAGRNEGDGGETQQH